MTSSILIRPGMEGDAERIVEFNRLLARETESKNLDSTRLRNGVRRALADPKLARYFVAEIEGEIVGQIMLTKEWSDWRDGEIWWIQSVYVLPVHRNKGIYRALHRHVRELARATPGVAGLRLYVERENTAAQTTYLKLGMRSEGYLVFGELWSGSPDADHCDG